MTNWSDPAIIQNNALVFSRFIHALFGLYAWEWFGSLDFELDLLMGRKKFRWPLIFYFANRYLLLGAMTGIIISLDTPTELNCQSLYTFNQLAGNASAGLASINLSLRTMAIWQHNKWVDGGLILVILGHWSLILQGVLMKAVWVPGQGCLITETNTTVLSAVFIYTMSFDLIVLCLNIFKLSSLSLGRTVNRELAQSRLAKLIFHDGLIYFVIAFLSNTLATIFMLMNWNAIMSIFFNVPAVIASSIVACRAVRRLMNFATQPVEIYGNSSSQPTAGPMFRQNTTRNKNASILPIQSYGNVPGKNGAGVHVQMETFTKEEAAQEKDVAYLRDLDKAQHFTVGVSPHVQPRTPDSDSDLDLEGGHGRPF